MTSGADVAWITDELDRPGLIDRVLAAQGRARLWGAVTGIISFGVLTAVTSLGRRRGCWCVDGRARRGNGGPVARTRLCSSAERSTVGDVVAHLA